MKSLGRLIGIDVGTRRVGLARTDLLRLVPVPAGTWSPEEVIDVLEKEVETGPVVGFVVGWPLSSAGQETDATLMVDAFIKRLKKHFPGIPIYRSDERYTSKEAVQTMIRAGVPKRKRSEKGRVDRVAAALILQQFLDTYSEEE